MSEHDSCTEKLLQKETALSGCGSFAVVATAELGYLAMFLSVPKQLNPPRLGCTLGHLTTAEGDL